MFKRIAIMLMTAVWLSSFSLISQAELFRVGPSDLPSPPGHGYPLWYQDSNGLALDLCVPQTLTQLDACLATPAPGDPNPTLPYTFPDNWSDEFFWFGAEALLDFGNGESALLVQAVEAAFAGGPPAVGDQIAFARIRIRFVAPVDGTYTVTFPYGEEIFPNIAAGEQVFFTSDVGLGAPGDFSGALGGAIGPFLTAVENDGMTAKPNFTIDGGIFLADPTANTQVTGSPFSTNYFEVCVDNPLGINGAPCVFTNQFALIGKVHTTPIASPLDITRATYTTHAETTIPMAHIDVFANAEAGPGAATPVLTVGIIGGASARMMGPTAPGGQFYGQATIEETMIPAMVTVINSADTPPSSMDKQLVDEVTILEASYNAMTSTLSIQAKSSDELGLPALSAVGIPGSVGSDLLVIDASTGVGIASIELGSPLAPPLAPPQSVTVVSSAGGSATQRVSVPEHGDAFPTGAPLAADDMALTDEGMFVDIFILDNDGGEAEATLVSVITGPANGLLNILIDGTVNYTPNPGFFGFDSFEYTVDSGDGLSSNIATVSIEVTQFNDVPVANSDPINAPNGVTSFNYNVTANDTDADGVSPEPGGLDPASVDIVANSVFGNLTIDSVNPAGTVSFTIGDCTTTSCSFSYTVSDIGTADSPVLTSLPALVTIQSSGVNMPPIANNDTASVTVEGEVTIDVAFNDTDPDNMLDLSSIILTAPISGGMVRDNDDGTVTYTAPATIGTDTFTYTIQDNLGDVSNIATVTVTINPFPDTLAVQRAQCKSDKNEWRVDGTSSILTPHSVTLYDDVTGEVLAANLPVDNLGAWRMSKNNTSAACVESISIESISIESSVIGRLENVFVNVR